MSYTEFKDIIEIIQAIIISFGILIGGIWAIYRFMTLHEVDKAKIELIQIKKQIEERGTIQMSAEIEKIAIDEDYFVIAINVKLINTGNRTEVLDLLNCDIQVGQIAITNENVITISKPISTKLTSIKSPIKFSSISPNDEKCYPFIFKLTKGIYLFELRVPGSLVETKRHLEGARETGLIEDGDIVVWGLTKFFHVV